jgi:hypothetical protein
MFKKGVIFSSFAVILLPILLLFPDAEVHAGLTYLGQETPIVVPDCIASSDTAIVQNYSELIAATSNAAINVVCLEPGHYFDARLDIPGSEATPKYLIPNHPVGVPLTEPWNQSEAERVIFDNDIDFLSEYWYVVGITVRADTPAAITFETGSFGNVLDRVLVEGFSERLATGTGGQTMVRMGELSTYNTVQNSVIRNSPRIPHQDSHCLYVANSQYNTIINNEIYDCAGDSIQFGWLPGSSATWDDRGNKIINNEMYITPRLYAVCSDPSENANLNGPGDCACAENALDIKIISADALTDPNDLVEISHNTTYGFRENHQSCGGTGDSGAPAIYLHHEFTSNARISNNLIFDADSGILILDIGAGGMTNIEVYNNVLYNIRTKSAIQLGGGTGNRVSHNTMILTLTDDNNRKSIRISPSAVSSTIAHNLTISENILYKGFMDATHPDPNSLVIGLNGYVGLATPIRNAPSVMDIELPDEPLSNYDDLCVTLQRYTDAVQSCIPYVLPNASSGIIDIFRNPKFSYRTDFFDNQRVSPRDLGAVEYQSP